MPFNLDSYIVPDLLHVECETIFILESPHTQEVKNGYPVAGKSGKDISKVLFDDEELKLHSFGELIYNKTIKKYGIINVSTIPLQASAYEITSPYFKDFSTIRANPKRRKKPSLINDILEIMREDFIYRTSTCRDKKIILCGAFVQSFFYETFSKDEFKNIINVPHPSFNNWQKEKYKETIEDMKRFIDA